MRFATLEDEPRIVEMLREFLLEQHKLGSPVEPNRKALDRYRELIHAYLTGTLFGIVVVTDAVTGFVLAGEDSGVPVFDTALGKTASVWVIWVEPEMRKTEQGLEMLIFGRPRLIELGFETAVMSVREENAAGQAITCRFGARPIERVFQYPLKEVPRG